jgi:thiamine-monophosphate kinase
VSLSERGEFGFIERMRSWLPDGGATVGIGDDAAVVETTGNSVVAATDALVEGVHFRSDWSSPSDTGFKAVSVNVSDIAAMGACPRWILLALCAPPETTEEVLRGLYEGIEEACAAYGTELVGGDTVRAPQLTLVVTAIGELEGKEPVTRSGAEVGDVVAVTGPLGRAAVGVNLLLSQDAKDSSPEDAIACMAAHRRPRARVDAGAQLHQVAAHAAIDLSDGLGSDARRLSESSGVGFEIDLGRVPVAPEAGRIAAARGWDIERIVLGGGEDFELLVALPREQLEGTDWIEIGRVVDDGLWLVRDGQSVPLPDEGYDHFRT